MQKIGIIAEYNPFHNGHIYHIQKIKKLYPNSLIILVLNGYFLQRGEISILTKEAKAKIALQNGVDLIVELPFVFGTQSADIFANAAIKILNELKCDSIICGSESNDLATIQKLAQKQIKNKAYDDLVKEYLKTGINYPTALAKALKCDFTFLPNDLLAISYQKAIYENNYALKLETIKRTSDYHDLKSTAPVISASNIREKIHKGNNIKKYLPLASIKEIKTINKALYFKILKYQIMTCPNLKVFLDVDEGLEYRLKKVITNVESLDELITQVKTKRYTYNKLNRLFIHLLSQFTKEDNQKLAIDYLKILGFNARGQRYLNKIKKELTLPLTRDINSLVFQYELRASLIYDLINGTNTYDFELKNKPIKLDMH